MGTHRLDSVSDFVRHGFNIRVVCLDCKRASVMNALQLLETLTRAKQSTKIPHVAKRLKCGWCDSKNAQLGPSG
jgi:hypothetical protein